MTCMESQRKLYHRCGATCNEARHSKDLLEQAVVRGICYALEVLGLYEANKDNLTCTPGDAHPPTSQYGD